MKNRVVSAAGSCLALCLVTAATAFPSHAGGVVDPAAVVASFEVELPQVESFLLRGTLPVPRNTYFPGSNTTPLVVVLPDGSAARTQIERVTSYASAGHGADVVELIARVNRPPGMFPGERARYDIALVEQAKADFTIHPQVEDFFDGSGTLALRTRDVFGHSYRADLLRDRRIDTGERVDMREGEQCSEFRTHEILRPTQPQSGPQATLPHLMGVHSYLRFWRDEKFFSLDLHVHNGMDGNDSSTAVDNALDKVYFESLELELPQGWRLLDSLEHPFFGRPYNEGSLRVWPFVKELEEDKLHVMERQARFVRRFVITRADGEEGARATLREGTLGFCVPGVTPSGAERWSWWNADTARYYPQSHRLPTLDHVGLDTIRHELSSKFRTWAGQVASGNSGQYPYTESGLGWAHPWGIRYGGMTGGDEIWIYDGVETAAAASQDGYRTAQLVGRAYVDRQPTALFNKTGRPTRLEDWLHPNGLNGPWMPMYFNLVPSLPDNDVFGFNYAPDFQSLEVERQGRKPDYETRLITFSHIDHQHYVRYTRSLKTMLWLGNDSLSKDDFELASELFRLSFHEYNNSNYGHIQGSGLKAKMIATTQNPGQGLGFGRGEAWALDASLCAYASGGRELRARSYPWYRKIAKILRDGQSDCTGCIQAWPSTNYLSGQYRLRQSFETAITDNVIRGLRETVFAGQSPQETQRLDQVLVRSVRASISPMFWNEQQNAPWNFIAVGPIDSSQPLYCGSVPAGAHSDNVDLSTFWSSFAYAWEVEQDLDFLRHPALMTGGGNLFQSLTAAGTGNLGNRAALLALVQSLQ